MSLSFLRQTAEFKALIGAVGRPGRGPLVTGVTEAAKPFVLAGLAAELGRRVVCVRPPSRSLASLENGCRFFLSRLHPALDAASLPPLAGDPYLEIPAPLEAVSARMDFLRGALRGEKSLVITNPFGVLKPVPRPEDLERSFLSAEVGRPLDRDGVLQTLSAYGYSREDLIASPGEYAWRGGIVDVFPPRRALPLRIEFGGDKVVSIREFDMATQRSVKRIDRVLIPSLREYPGSPEFLEAWTPAASRAAGDSRADFEEKLRFLERGEDFPSFVYLALLARDRFVPVTSYLEDAVFILDDGRTISLKRPAV